MWDHTSCVCTLVVNRRPATMIFEFSRLKGPGVIMGGDRYWEPWLKSICERRKTWGRADHKVISPAATLLAIIRAL
jgi:hypothetical protein